MQQAPKLSRLSTVNQDVVELLYSNVFNGLAITLLSISAITFGFDSGSAQYTKQVIWAVMLVLLLIRALDGAYRLITGRAARNTSRTRSNTQAARTRYRT